MKITLKCTVMCLIYMFVFSSACAQDLTDDGNKKIWSKANEGFDEFFDKDFNSVEIGHMVNGVFVKSYAGVNLDSLCSRDDFRIDIRPSFAILTDNDTVKLPHIATKNAPVLINGAGYTGIFNFTASDVELDFASFDDIKSERYPEVLGPCVYMLNKHLVFDDVESYRIDRNFILDTELISSKQFEALKNVPEFSIIRIYTKTERNMQDYPHKEGTVRLK